MNNPKADPMARIARTLAAVALTGATMVAGLAAPAAAAGEEPSAPTMSCSELWQSLPQRLQGDIIAARSLPPRAERIALRSIRLAAQRGAYGDEVEKLADARQERRQELWAAAPDQLRADVRAAWSLPFRQQRLAMQEIREAALAGAYGEAVQAVAQARRDWLMTCPRSGDAI
jgi:hypothetical protein